MARDKTGYVAKDIMSSPVVTAGPDATVGDACQTMLERGFGALPIAEEDGKYVGLVTENWFMPRPTGIPMMRGTTLSLLGKLVGDPENLEETVQRVKSIRVGDVIEPNPPVAAEDTPVGEIAATMATKNVHHVPILRGDKVVGMVSRHDLLKIFATVA